LDASEVLLTVSDIGEEAQVQLQLKRKGQPDHILKAEPLSVFRRRTPSAQVIDQSNIPQKM
jgi:hypothetical protein